MGQLRFKTCNKVTEEKIKYKERGGEEKLLAESKGY